MLFVICRFFLNFFFKKEKNINYNFSVVLIKIWLNVLLEGNNSLLEEGNPKAVCTKLFSNRTSSICERVFLFSVLLLRQLEFCIELNSLNDLQTGLSEDDLVLYNLFQWFRSQLMMMDIQPSQKFTLTM